MLLSTGISHDRIEILGCAANNGECHAVTVLDKVYVYDVNYNHVVRKNSLTYEWYLKIL